jgi:DNA-binding ferritin-like protein
MNIVSKFLTFRDQTQILHWQTTSFAEHKALGELYEKLDANIDEFVETFMGKYGRVVSQTSFSLTLENYKNLSPLQFMDVVATYLIEELPTMLDAKKDSDLLNIRDAILGDINQTKYLLTLK